jgi:hypothetical protein
MWDQFPTFLGGGPKRKKILKAGPTLFLACGENIFPHGKNFWDFTCDRKIVKSENISPPRRKKVG